MQLTVEQLALLTWIIACLRWFCAVMSIPVVVLSWRGFLDFGNKNQSIPNGLKSIAFIMGFSSGTYQWGWVLEANAGAPVSVRLLLSLITTAVGLAASLLLLLRLRKMKVREYDLIGRHIGIAMAIVELDSMDPVEAKKVAEECRRKVAELRVGGFGG